MLITELNAQFLTCVFMSLIPKDSFFLAGSGDDTGDLADFRGEFLMFGDAALLRKLPIVDFCGDGKPMMFGTGTCGSAWKEGKIAFNFVSFYKVLA